MFNDVKCDKLFLIRIYIVDESLAFITRDLILSNENSEIVLDELNTTNSDYL